MFAALGEALVDLIEHADGRYEPCLGGSVCNFTRAVARQGEAIRYLNPLSTDTFGERFVARLRDDGVAIDPPWRSDCPTSLAVVSLGAGGVPQYVFHREHVADRDGSAAQLIERMPMDTALLHVGGLALIPPDDDKVMAVMAAARDRGALISVDANLRTVVVGRDAQRQQAYRQAVSRVLGQADIIKLSDEDITHMGWGVRADDDEGMRALAQHLVAQGAGLVALTLGAAGAWLVNAKGAIKRSVPQGITVVDTVGAGDCFQAGMLVWLKKSGRLVPGMLSALGPDQLDQALEHAMAAAAINVQRQGCQPPSWLETRGAVEQARLAA